MHNTIHFNAFDYDDSYTKWTLAFQLMDFYLFSGSFFISSRIGNLKEKKRKKNVNGVDLNVIKILSL